MRTPTEIVHLDDDDNRDQNEIEGELEKKKHLHRENWQRGKKNENVAEINNLEELQRRI